MRRTNETRTIGGKEFLTELAATKYLGFRNRLTMYRRRRYAGLPFYKIGQEILYSRQDLDEFIEQRRRVKSEAA